MRLSQASHRRCDCLAAAAPVAAVPTAPTATPTGKALMLVPLTLTKVDDSSFGTIVPSAIVGHRHDQRDTGTRTVAGGVDRCPERRRPARLFRRCRHAEPAGHHHADPARLELTSVGGDTIPVLALTLDKGRRSRPSIRRPAPSSSASAASSSIARQPARRHLHRDLHCHRRLPIVRRIEAARGGRYLGPMHHSASRNHPRQNRRVACDGSGEVAAALGHPRVYLRIDAETGFVECGYCDRRFVLEGGPADSQRHRDRADPRRLPLPRASIRTRRKRLAARHLARPRRWRALPAI